MRKWVLGILCFVAGLVVVPLIVLLYLDTGRPPVAVSDPPFPLEKKIVRKILDARIASETQTPPLSATPEVLEAGAVIYKDQCAVCHGTPNGKSTIGANMYPSAPRLWASHRAGVVGVSDDPVGETFWRVKNGIRLTGMPSYKTVLTDEQIWQVSLLLSSAAKPLPDKAQQILTAR